MYSKSSGPCGDYGACTNTIGSFSCACNQNYTGRTCQFEKRCSPDLCLVSGIAVLYQLMIQTNLLHFTKIVVLCAILGEVCIEGFSGYTCKIPDPSSSVVVSGPSVSAGELTDHVQLFIDRALQVSSN